MIPGTTPTPLDIKFQAAGFPVRVTPWFWLTLGLLGYPLIDHPTLGPLALVIWIAAGFVSILIHELGHTISAGWFRTPAVIVLGAFAGFAVYTDRAPPSGWRRLVVCLMGPGAGFLLYGLVAVSQLSTDWMGLHPVLMEFGNDIVFMCLYWGLLNLLPIFPLDGGQSLREIFYIVGMRRPDALAHRVGVSAAGLLLVLSIVAVANPGHPAVSWLPFYPDFYMFIFFGFLAFYNWQLLQQENSRRSWEFGDREPWR